MNRPWLKSILVISIVLLLIQRTHELESLATYFRSERVIKIKAFEDARKLVSKDDLEHLKLWESILTGRSAPLSRLLKERYQSLGLNHLFTPSGFHLSAVLLPFMKLIKHQYQIWIYILLGIGLALLPGLMALKRMLLIKGHQHILGMHLGFGVALLIDMFFGSFQNGALSFTYSFLFLGIIYSGLKGVGLIIWFFIGQIILAYFQNSDISILLLLFSPLLNFAFGIIMPVLFLLSFPLWNWQLYIGIYILRYLQKLVEILSEVSFIIPVVEVHVVVLIMISLILFRKYKAFLMALIFFSSSLNLDRERSPGVSTNEFVPQGKFIKSVYQEKVINVYFEDGRCKMKLVRGYWWENCSPRRRNVRRSNHKKIKKLSYLSEELQMSSLHG